jgi:hypothetical protein
MSEWELPVGGRLPKRWIIAPANVLGGDTEAAAHCPKPSSTLIAFAITNAIVSVLGILAGYRPFVHAITGGCCGKPGARNTIKFSWIAPLVLHLFANLIIGAVIHTTPEYGQVRVIDVMMIYLVRPRISVIFLLFMTTFFRIKKEYRWLSALIGNSIAEFIIQCAADIWVVLTSRGEAWNRMIGVIVGMFISTALMAIGLACIIFTTRPQDGSGGDIKNHNYNGIKTSNSIYNRFLWWVLIMAFVGPGYLLSWLFFAALIFYAREEWCPPKLGTQIALWVSLPVLGTFVGSMF